MSTTLKSLLTALFLTTLITACGGPDALYDITDNNFELLTEDSTQVDFPGDYKGNISVISFIFTNCPDVCPLITANMTNIQRELDDTTGINFIEISFDPERDTPSVLKKYKEQYRLNEQFTMLTGDTAHVHPLLDRLDIVAQKIYADSASQDSSKYDIRHSNTIYLMDQDGYIRAEYPAHRVTPEHVKEDINYLRSE
ncbi:MAG: SCO family protein [Bacteroidota bacterium]